MSVDILKSDIKEKSFRKVYFIYGEELYLKRFYVETLINTVLFDDPQKTDLFKADGKRLALEDFHGQLESFPFISEKKVITLYDTPLSSSIINYLLENPQNLNEDTVIILVNETEKYDSRTKEYKSFLSFIKQNGLDINVSSLEDRTKQKWVVQCFKKKNKEISQNSLLYFLENIDNDMYILGNEIEKLSAYAADRNEITIKDIDATCVKTVEARGYELTNAMLDGNLEKSYILCDKLFEMNTNENQLLGAIFSYICSLYKIVQMQKEGMSISEISKNTGMKDYALKKQIEKLIRISEKSLCIMIEKCTEADLSAKGSSIDGKLIVTKLITECVNTVKGSSNSEKKLFHV